MDTNYIQQLPIPACVISKEGIITAANPLLRDVWVYDEITGSNFFTISGIRRQSLVGANTSDVLVERSNRVFKLRVNEGATMDSDIFVYFDEITLRESLRKKVEADLAVVAFINIDNYDELMDTTDDDARRVIPSQIDQLLRRYGDRFDSPVMRKGEDEYIMLSTKEDIDRMIEDNFSVLEEVRNIETEIEFPLSVSFGIGISTQSLNDTTELASDALELALGRGGDQAVVKTEEGTAYYGGTKQSVEKNNRGKARVVAHVMKSLIAKADKVLVMGHRWPDMDSFGSAIGAYSICRYFGKDTYIVLDRYNDALTTIYKHAENTEDYKIIKSEKALKLVTDKTLLIIVDVNRPMLMECAELVDVCKTRMVIDHHRLTEDSIQNTAVHYIESYASSASELMAELIQNVANKRFINRFESEAMLAGIMVDSNNFSGRTGVRTFEAAAWLKRGGADTTEVKRFFQIDPQDFKIKADAIAGADFDDSGIAYAITLGDSGNTQIINAQVADELLMVKGVKASIVMGKNDRGETLISARSLGNVNVQTIMEKMGGGGHFTSAAAQVTDSITDVNEKVRRIVADYLDREKDKDDN